MRCNASPGPCAISFFAHCAWIWGAWNVNLVGTHVSRFVFCATTMLTRRDLHLYSTISTLQSVHMHTTHTTLIGTKRSNQQKSTKRQQSVHCRQSLDFSMEQYPCRAFFPRVVHLGRRHSGFNIKPCCCCFVRLTRAHLCCNVLRTSAPPSFSRISGRVPRYTGTRSNVVQQVLQCRQFVECDC